MQERENKRLANPDAQGWPQDEYSADLGHGDELVDHGEAAEETRTLGNHEALPPALEGLNREAREELVILVESTQLRQGSTYVDLDDLDSGPFQALGSQSVEDGQRLVPKHRVGYELWNRLVGQGAERETVRPDTEGG